MLTHLQIKNFTIIDLLDVEFQAGMTVLTGETGAGKSIIIDALELVLGGRFDSKAIRPNSEKCEITASFDVTQINDAKEWLNNHDIETNDEAIIRRIINRDGKSKSTINGTIFPQQLIREFGALLLNIHGQHEFQFLLQRDKQLALLDIYANHQPILKKLTGLYQDWHNVQTEIQALADLTQNHEEKRALLAYQLSELETLALAENEIAELHQEHKQLINVDSLLKYYQDALEILNNSHLHAAKTALAKIAEIDANICTAQEIVETAAIQLTEATDELQTNLRRIEPDPERLQWVEKRLETIYNIARKHHIKPEELFNLHLELKNKLASITLATTKAATLSAREATLLTEYQQVANNLSLKRQKIADKLNKEITSKMHELNMPHGEFNIQFTAAESTLPNPSGLDQIEFQVRTNKGHPMQPLHKIASGGELSRLSLAIQVITAEKYHTPTLIFDEIDTGISGKTAQVVGKLLKQLSQNTQVFCVTHLPQIAAKGNNHLKVDKNVVADVTITQLTSLTHENKITEIARMLSGDKITKQSLGYAEELLQET
jgi:DNA repair protein RecN (Recombination protein N)